MIKLIKDIYRKATYSLFYFTTRKADDPKAPTGNDHTQNQSLYTLQGAKTNSQVKRKGVSWRLPTK